MNLWNICVQCEPGNFGIMPLDRERNGGVAEDAEVKSVMRVLPHVIAVDNKITPEGLLKPCLKVIAEPRVQPYRCGGDQSADNRVYWPKTRKHQVFVEWSFQCARVGHSKDGVARLDSVGNTDSRFGLAGNRQPIVKVAAHAQVEEPRSLGDLVLKVERKFLHV